MNKASVPSHSASRNALTIVELLVVVAVIAVLAGMLIAGTGAIRISARTAQCANNLRQISGSCLTYAVDNKGTLPGPEMYHAAKFYWWDNIAAFGTETFTDIYLCPESNFSKREIHSWNEGGVYPKLFNVWGGAANKSTYAQAFHGSSYGMNNQITYGFLTTYASWLSNYPSINPYGQPFAHMEVYSSRVAQADKYIYLADKQARPMAGFLPAQYAQIWPSGLLNDPTKKSNSIQHVRDQVIQWGTELPVDADDQTVRANHRRRANMVFFDGHIESRDPITGLCDQGRNVANAYTGAQ